MFEHAEQASSRGVLEGGGGGATGLLNKGGGSNRLPGLVAKQAVEFPQVYTSKVINKSCNNQSFTPQVAALLLSSVPFFSAPF